MRIRFGRIAVGIVAGAIAASAPTPARAHFYLVAPDSWMSQGQYGDPQKVGPCGEEGGGRATGKITVFRPGEAVEVTIDERIFHPGHYRVALALQDRAQLPPPPAVTAVGSDPCGSAEIQDPPIFPVLADNLLPHTRPFDGPQTFTVTLPNDVTCTRCTLQVIEYMSNHGRPCFYHHCADIAIQDEATPTSTAAATPTATPPPCPGDCDGGGKVTVNEIITLVRIALEQAPIESCPAGNADGNLRITVDEILAAVKRALAGCAPSPSANP